MPIDTVITESQYIAYVSVPCESPAECICCASDLDGPSAIGRILMVHEPIEHAGSVVYSEAACAQQHVCPAGLLQPLLLLGHASERPVPAELKQPFCLLLQKRLGLFEPDNR